MSSEKDKVLEFKHYMKFEKCHILFTQTSNL